MTPPDSGEREVRLHRCIRCGSKFACSVDGCVAPYDVLPTAIRGGAVMEAHNCNAAAVSLPLPLAQRILADLEEHRLHDVAAELRAIVERKT